MRKSLPLLSAIILLFSVAGAVHAAQLTVLSDGPLEPALVRIAEVFRRRSGHEVTFVFGLSPVIQKKVSNGEPADVIIIQPDVVAELVKAGRLGPGEHPGEYPIVARVGVGLMVRADAVAPDISTPEALKQALLRADSLVFSNVAAGNHFATVLERLGITDAVKGKITRTDPADVVARIVRGTGNDIGIGTITLIIKDTRLKLVGALPPELQRYLVYTAVPAATTHQPEAAKQFIRFLASPESKREFSAAGAN